MKFCISWNKFIYIPIEILTDPNEFLLVETYPVRYNDKQLLIYKEYYNYYKNLYNNINNTIKIEKYNDILDVSSLKPLNKVDTKVKIDDDEINRRRPRYNFYR